VKWENVASRTNPRAARLLVPSTWTHGPYQADARGAWVEAWKICKNMPFPHPGTHLRCPLPGGLSAWRGRESIAVHWLERACVGTVPPPPAPPTVAGQGQNGRRAGERSHSLTVAGLLKVTGNLFEPARNWRRALDTPKMCFPIGHQRGNRPTGDPRRNGQRDGPVGEPGGP